MPNRELVTFDDFRKVRLDDVGFIVIKGSARSLIVHKLNGRCVSADNFRVKALDDKGAGSYYWVDSLSSAATELGASICKVCKPHRPDKEPWKT